MSVILDPNWTFEELVAAAWSAYSSRIQFSGYRINTIKTWGNVVGKSTALERFYEFISNHGTKKKAAEAAGMSYSTLRGIELFYKSLPDDFLVYHVPRKKNYVVDEVIGLEEDVYTEFKDISSKSPAKAICQSYLKYAISFLNSEGGRIFWGVEDLTGKIIGIELNGKQRDKIKKGVQNAVNSIVPEVDPTAFSVDFIKLTSEQKDNDRYLVVAVIPKSNMPKVYFSPSGDCWVRVNGVTQLIKGPIIQELILGKQKFQA